MGNQAIINKLNDVIMNLNREISFVSDCKYGTSSTKLYIQVLPNSYGNSLYFYTDSSELCMVRVTSDNNYIAWLFENSHLLLSMLEQGNQWYNETEKSLQPLDPSKEFGNRLFVEIKQYYNQIRDKTLKSMEV
jgi:hypothetical protein